MRRIALRALLGATALSGLVVAARAALGPLATPIPVNSPLNAEGCFGICLTFAFFLRAGEGSPETSPRHSAFGWRDWGLMAGLMVGTCAAFWRALYFYPLSDDFVLLRLGKTLRFGLPALFTTAGGDGFFRPAGYVSLVVSSMWAGLDPARWHACGLALHVVNSALVYLLASRLAHSRWAAFFAAALFAIHGSRPEAAVWIAGRFDLLATFFVLCGLLFFMRPHGPSRLAALACMMLALLSKESAYVFPLLLLLLRLPERDSWCQRVRALLPFFALAAALFVYRWSLLGGLGGYRGGALGFAPALKALALRLWAVLYFPINWSTEPGGWHALSIAACIVSLGVLAMSRVQRAQLIFPAGLTLVSALPPLQQLLIGADLQKSRLLYLPSIGFCLLLAAAADGLKGRSRWVVPGIILLASLFTLQHNLDAWEYASGKARPACVAAVRCLGSSRDKLTVVGLPGSLRGAYFFQNGFPECVQIQPNGASVQVELKQVAGTSPVAHWRADSAELVCGAEPPYR